MMLSIYMQGT